MKVCVIIFAAFVAYTSATNGVSSYQSGLSGRPIQLSGASLNQGQVGRRAEEPRKTSRRTIIIAQPEETGRNYGSGRSRQSGQVQVPVNYGINSGISNVQKLNSGSYSQPILAAQPIRTVQVASPPISTPQLIRTAKVSSTPIIPVQPVQKSNRRVIIAEPNRVPVSSGGSKQSNVRPVSYSQPIITAQPVRTVQVVPQKVVSTSPISLGGASYGSGLGSNQNRGQAISRVNYNINSGISKQQNVRPVSYSQPIIAAQPVRTVQVVPQKVVSTSPISLGGASYGSGLGSNQNRGQTISRVNYDINSGISKQQNVRPVSYSQPITTPQPVRTVQVVPQKVVSSSPISLGGAIYGSGLGLNQNQGQQQQNGRPVSYSQPIIAAQPIRTVQKVVSSSPISLGGVSLGLNQNQEQAVRRVNYDINNGISNQQPIIKAQPVQTVQAIPQKLVSSSPINLGSLNYGSGLALNRGQNVRQVNYDISNQQNIRPVSYSQPIQNIQVVPQRIASNSLVNLGAENYGSYGLNQGQAIRRVNYDISNQQNVRPVSYSPQPIITSQPIQTVQAISQPQVYSQQIRTIQLAPQQIISRSPISLGGASFGSGLGQNQGQSVRLNYGINSGRQLNIGPVTYPQQIITQPIRTVQVSSQPIISTSRINLGGATNYGSGLGLNQGQPIRQISISQPSLSTGNYGLTGSGYDYYSQPIYTNYYNSGSGFNDYGKKK